MADQTKMDVPGGDVTQLGFGGKQINRRIEVGDVLYLVLRCEVVSDGRTAKANDDGELKYKAGAKTEILAEITASEATKIATDHAK